MEEIEAFLSFSTLIFNLSLFKAFLKTSESVSVSSFNSSSLVSSLKLSERSASIRWNFKFSFLPSKCVTNGWSILCVRITASMPSSLNILIYWLCSVSSVT